MRKDDGDSIDGDNNNNSNNNKNKNSNNNNEKSKNDAFEIVCSQRDRFRDKMQNFEKYNVKLESRIERLENDKQLLKDENVQLFQKIKFLESYSNNNSTIKRMGLSSTSEGPSVITSSTNVLSNNSLMTNRSNRDVLSKYQVLYEDSLNPFAQFREKEKQSRIENLQWTEWIAYYVGSTVLSRKMFRVFATIYAIFLHLLTFFSLLHEFRSHGFHLHDDPDCLHFINDQSINNNNDLPPVILQDG